MNNSLTHEERHKALLEHEGSKDDLIKVECIFGNIFNSEAKISNKLQDLIRENAGLTRNLSDKSSDLKREVNNCRSYYQQNHDREIELEGFRRKMAGRLFSRSGKID